MVRIKESLETHYVLILAIRDMRSLPTARDNTDLPKT